LIRIFCALTSAQIVTPNRLFSARFGRPGCRQVAPRRRVVANDSVLGPETRRHFQGGFEHPKSDAGTMLSTCERHGADRDWSDLQEIVDA